MLYYSKLVWICFFFFNYRLIRERKLLHLNEIKVYYIYYVDTNLLILFYSIFHVQIKYIKYYVYWSNYCFNLPCYLGINKCSKNYNFGENIGHLMLI